MTASAIVEKMMESDAFSQWLGIRVVEVHAGFCCVEMTTRAEMVNGFGILHGGITYSLADSALAFASNSRGHHAISIETQISHLKKVGINELLTARTEEISSGKKIAVYQIQILNEKEELVALFKGTVYKQDVFWV